MQQHTKEVSGVALRDCNEGAASSARLRERAAVACPLAKASSFSPDCPGAGALRTMQYNAGKKETEKKCSLKAAKIDQG